MSKEVTTKKEEVKKPNKPFFNPKAGKGNFFNQRNTFTKQIRNNHRPQG